MKGKPHLILTVDYELFGDGSGCIEHCVTNPAASIISLANSFSAKTTFFVDTMEFSSIEQKGTFSTEMALVKQQLVSAVLQGHDVQLHLHPQWHAAKYNEDNKWLLDMSHWRIGDIPYTEILKYIKSGKSWIENLLHPTSKDYRCIAFRAGGWCIQPSHEVIRGLIECGLLIDSTVAPGYRSYAKGEWCNFTCTPDNAYWRVDSDVCSASKTGLWEVPIMTGKIGRLRHINALKSSRTTDNNGLACGCNGSYQGPDGKFQTFMGKASKLLRLGKTMLDFSTMPADVLIETTTQWLDHHSRSGYSIPIVGIAHTKNFTSSSAIALSKYLDWASTNNIQFSTYGQWLDTVDA